jgi:hypothetical protein
MPLHQNDIIKVCEILAEQEELKVTTNEALKGACFTFAGAFVGGFIGGPLGLGIGSAAAGAVAAYKSQGKFKSAVYVIMYEMSENEKQKLANSVKNVISSIDTSDVLTLVTMLNSNRIIRDSVIALIKNTLTSDMGLTLA